MSDSESSPSAEAPAASVTTQTRGLRVARALLAPVLVLGAVGVHFSLNVPEEKVVVKPRDQGSKKANKARRPSRFAVPERSVQELDRAWARWSEQPFDGEPIKGKWGRRQQSIVNKAVVLARKEAFRGAPEDPRVVVSGTQCRTIRCRFILRSPYQHEPGLVAEALERQRYDGEPLWRIVQTEVVDPPTPQSPKKDHYLQVVIGVSLDGIDTKEIEFAPEKGAAAKPDDAKADDEKAPAKDAPATGTPKPAVAK
ncbi:MAG: hypothetical protein AAGA54_02060 [Myxococcota bacterium]